MSPSELEKLANTIKNDDPNTAIILLVLAGAKIQQSDGLLTELCQDFARMFIYNHQYNEWISKA